MTVRPTPTGYRIHLRVRLRRTTAVGYLLRACDRRSCPKQTVVRNESVAPRGVVDFSTTVSLGLYSAEPCARITPADFGRDDSLEQRLIRARSVLICR